MPRTARYLFKAATGRFPVPSETLGSFLPGVAPGVRVSDYFVDGWTWDASGQPTSLAWPYLSGTSWAMTFTIDEGAKAKLIRRAGNVLLVLDYAADAEIIGEQIEIIASSVNNSDSLGSATLRLVSSQPPSGNIISYTSYDRDYNPNQPPAGVTGTARFEIIVSSPGTLRDVTYTINVQYVPDIGPFNPNLTKQFIVQATDRSPLASDLDVQWSTDGVNHNDGDGIIHDVAQAYVGEDITRYYRWRLMGSGDAYSAWATATYIDPRFI